MEYTALVNEESLQKTISSLKKGNIESVVVENKDEAREKILAMIPKGAEVMTMSSVTLKETGLIEAINESGEYDSVKSKLSDMDRETQGLEMQKIGAAPEWALGSVHAITENGQVVIASNTGSQLPGYAYGSSHVIWVVGTQKIVKDLDAAFNRIYDYVLPLESERLNAQYNVNTGSNVSKLLIVNKEVKPGRITVVFVKEKLGF